ncbi:hypothetical protein [Arthrobacter agilis]|uniref:hypothetical protein n=1 Tax=Arthrobacter agilis TaxID=37921 RepID=UPI0027827BD4|nr:hypothetical protein [Arthrobacter agilis]MDQ0737067.1 hypothetical protein [Arthrobacter agilis]
MASTQNDGEESGLAQAADSFAENLGDQVPDGVDNGPTDDADEPADDRTRTHASISEGMNANDDDEPPAVLDDGPDGSTRRTS